MESAKKTVLLVEDAPDNRLLATRVLTMGGFEPICAQDGADALAYLGSHATPDAIVLDLRMPVVDGWQFLAAQQRDPRIAGIPVVIFSCEHHYRGERGFTPNVVCCVSKTDASDVLIEAVRVAVSITRERRLHRLHELDRSP